ncbi:TPA: hypothetical protein SET14_001698 [Campylobacter coli]|nr:hypothetical protein [Campylobacter coli]
MIQNIKSTNDLKEKLYSIMSKWLSRHILSHDVMIIAWVNENLKKDENKALELNDLPPKQTSFISPFGVFCHTLLHLTPSRLDR